MKRYIKSNYGYETVMDQLNLFLDPYFSILDQLSREYGFTYEIKTNEIQGNPLSSTDQYTVKVNISSLGDLDSTDLKNYFKGRIELLTGVITKLSTTEEATLSVYYYNHYRGTKWSIKIVDNEIYDLPTVDSDELNNFETSTRNCIDYMLESGYRHTSTSKKALRIKSDVIPAIHKYYISRMNSILEESGKFVELLDSTVKSRRLKDPNRKYYTFRFKDDAGKEYQGYYSFVLDGNEWVPYSEIYDDSDEIWGEAEQVIS